ncbi:MAG: hypothetical protein GDYSWBUE_000608 [Candidatus Fervidibacterota bacterium]
MRLSREDVLHVAWLARLELDDDEVERFTWELNQILEHMEKLKELDVTDVEPTSHVIPMVNVFREDVAGKPLPREEVLANAPDATEEAFRVPRIVEES